MTAEAAWRPALQAFFDRRALAVPKRPGLAELCFIAGREPRLWSDPAVYDDLIDSIVEHCAIGATSSVLEVGCAGGYLAIGIARRVRHYHGVDLAPRAIKVARRLGIRNATFTVGDGSRLRFGDGSFDAVFCYFVFINIPGLRNGVALLREMLRVVKPGGRVMVGHILDGAQQAAYEARAPVVARDTEERYGPAMPLPTGGPACAGRRWRLQFRQLSKRAAETGVPDPTCYYYGRQEFVALGNELGASVEIVETHPRNPYFGFHYNAVYRKPR